MKRHKGRNVLLAGVWLSSLTLVGAAYFSPRVASSPTSPRKSTIQVKNLTDSVYVVRAERHNGHVKIALRNDSQRAITAYVIVSLRPNGDLFNFSEEFAYSENDTVIGPGETHETIFGIPSGADGRQDLSFTLSTVIFDDKTFEGDPLNAKRIADERMVAKAQLSRLLSFVEQTLRLPDHELSARLNRSTGELESSLGKSYLAFNDPVFNLDPKSARQVIHDSKVPDAIKASVNATKQRALEQFRAVQNSRSSDDRRQQLLRLRELWGRIIGRL